MDEHAALSRRAEGRGVLRRDVCADVSLGATERVCGSSAATALRAVLQGPSASETTTERCRCGATCPFCSADIPDRLSDLGYLFCC